MRIEQDIKLDFDDVFIKPKRSDVSSRSEVNLTRKFKMLNSKAEIEGIPIFAANLDTVGTFAMCRSLAEYKLFTTLHKFYPVKELVDFFQNDPANKYAFYTLGISEKDVSKLKSVSQEVNIEHICVDVASAYSKHFIDRLVFIRHMFPKAIIIAGNVATDEMCQEILINGGADIVKIGIGPGRFCQTRLVTGVGYPQLSSIIECADVAHGLGGHIIADGGCSTSGDICKAFGAGADFVMLGGMFSGCEECEGDWEYWDGNRNEKKRLKVYGMSSKEAMEKHYGKMSSYRSSEGACSFVDYKGPAKDTVEQILGGIRSACSYVGTSDLKYFSKCTTFIRKS